MNNFINIIKLFIYLLPIFWFFYALEDLYKLMGNAIYLFIYFIIYTCYTVRDINERCYRIEKKVMTLIDIEEDKRINEKVKKI